MRFHVVALDYDGTIATHGVVDEDTIRALEDVKKTGRKLLLVTGRQLEDLERVFPQFQLFDRIFAENGALVYEPATKRIRLLAEKPPAKFIEELRNRHVAPLSVGHVIVATWHPMETEVMNTIRDLGLELNIIFNKGAVMVLPSGIDKASGLKAALEELYLSSHNVVGVGDAENDHAFLEYCECSAVVANALPTLKEKVDYVANEGHGAGASEVMRMMIYNDPTQLSDRLSRHNIPIGWTNDKKEICLDIYGVNVMVAGSLGGGKSTLATSFIEKLTERHYQFCLIDPEGDHTNLERTTIFGDSKAPPNPDEIPTLLQQPNQNAVVSLIGLSQQDRPVFFERLFPLIQHMRARFGHPHWVILNEAHQLLPASRTPTPMVLPKQSHGLFLITVRPETVAEGVLTAIDILITLGDQAIRRLQALAERMGQQIDTSDLRNPESGEAIFWRIGEKSRPVLFRTIPLETEASAASAK